MSYIVAKGKLLLIKGDPDVDNSFFQQTYKHVADRLFTILETSGRGPSAHAFPLAERAAFYCRIVFSGLFFTPLFTFM